MASNILIKRSTGSTAPGTITYGELALTTGANGTQANAGDRLFACLLYTSDAADE